MELHCDPEEFFMTILGQIINENIHGGWKMLVVDKTTFTTIVFTSMLLAHWSRSNALLPNFLTVQDLYFPRIPGYYTILEHALNLHCQALLDKSMTINT